jgi:cysteinyl-tRNA synthetase
MWPFGKKTFPTISLTNTLSGTKEVFTPLKSPEVRIYSCGPTVYGPQHIGNLRAAVFSDTLARTLASVGYKVKRVVNITDVGHMVGDGDSGEDKMNVGAKRDKVSPKEIADRYSKQYLDDIHSLNIQTKHIRFPRATDYIPDQIKMIQTLEKRGHTYTLPNGVYFDTSTFPDYGKLGARDKVALEAGARVDMIAGKKNLQDFVLWRNAKPEDLQQWDSPWGKGNPGWSIECSAMIRALLGDTIDIHTGGEDHVSIHHNNEIAQSEGSTGEPLANYWLHNAFLTIDGEKISKSLGNIFVLDDVKKRGIHPLALRYLFLQAHYRSPLSFTWESLEAVNRGLHNIWKEISKVQRESGGKKNESEKAKELVQKVFASFFDDLNTSEGLGHLGSPEAWYLSPSEKWYVYNKVDELLGLSFKNPPEAPKTLTLNKLPEDLQKLAKEREEARKRKDFAQADELRIHMENRGYRVYDGALETTYIKTTQ